MTAWQRTPSRRTPTSCSTSGLDVGTRSAHESAAGPFPARSSAPAHRWGEVCRWDAAAVMFFPGRGSAPAESRPVVQRFDVDSVHHGSTAAVPAPAAAPGVAPGTATPPAPPAADHTPERRSRG
jgi:hypothetical protein